jgi:hypothetical protein
MTLRGHVSAQSEADAYVDRAAAALNAKDRVSARSFKVRQTHIAVSRRALFLWLEL